MTDTQNPEPVPELRSWLATWKSCAEGVLAQVSGQPMAFEFSADPFPVADPDLRYTVTASGAVAGEMSLRLSIESATRLAQKFMGETPAPATEPAAPLSADHKEAVEELLRQIAGQAATAVAGGVGGEVQLQLAAGTSANPAAHTVCLRTRDEAGTPVLVEVQIGAELASAIQTRAQAQAQAAEAAAAASAQDATAPPTPATPPEAAAPSPSPAAAEPTPVYEPPPPEAASYERLMDVGLEVKLRFGRRRMVLRDVLALSTGIVVELENHINTPVDLLLDGRTIAHGEVVVVDGKYGLRVTEVLDPRPSA